MENNLPSKMGVRVWAASVGLMMLVALLAPLCPEARGQTAGRAISWRAVLDQDPDWYGHPEAARIADNVLLYQHDNGGWPKNIDMARPLGRTDRDRLREERAQGNTELSQTTLDNGATHTQLRFLARVYARTGEARFREGFVRGLDYLLEAQYANGGWPQYYPLREGYYAHVTFNDGAMIGAMRLLREVARARPPYTFLDLRRRRQAAAAVEKGLDVILKTQVEVDGRLTVWCAQYRPDDLRCAKARSYELPALSGAESVEIVRYLMQIEEPHPRVVRAVEQAVDWFERVKLTGLRLIEHADPSLPKGYDLVVGFDPAGAAPMWARFYEIGTDYPMFVDRDGTVYYALSQIEHERRVGYRWLGSWAGALLERDYPAWRARWIDR